MEINKIEISGFKGISKLIISPKKINVLVGKNNTGKTSVLEAINYTLKSNEFENFPSPYEPPILYREISKLINVKKNEADISLKINNKIRLVRFKKLTLEEALQEFKKQILKGIKLYISRYNRHKNEKPLQDNRNDENTWREITKIIDEILNSKNAIEEIIKNSIKIETEDKNIYVFTRIPRELAASKLLEDYLKKSFSERRLIFTHFMSPLLLFPSFFSLQKPYKETEQEVTFIRNLQEPISEITKSKINEIENYLKNKQILKNLERFDFDEILFNENNQEYEIPYAFMGDGFKCLVGLLAQLSKNNKIILIEEPENHMHPAYIRELMRNILTFSKENNVQFFITTHNSDILDTVVLDLLEESYREFLEKELRIIRLESFGEDIVADELDRSSAKKNLEDIKLDLRGNS